MLFALAMLVARSLGAPWEAIVWGALACLAATFVERLAKGWALRPTGRRPPADRSG